MIHPNSLANLQKGRTRNDPIVQCPYCNKLIKKPNLSRHSSKCVQNPKFGTPCPKCGILKHPKKQTCSTGCYNSLFRSGLNNPNHQKGNNYRTICFHHHEKKCCVCGFDLIVEVHHLDENKHNNDPLNLVPLCPNHHQVWHSKHKFLIENQILNYIESKRDIA